jgi:hypothetical protein
MSQADFVGYEIGRGVDSGVGEEVMGRAGMASVRGRCKDDTIEEAGSTAMRWFRGRKDEVE